MRLHDLPRTWARRCLAMPRFCAEVLGTPLRDVTVVAAYSTGLDSTVLLHVLHALAPRQGLTLVAAHVHHGLRPESEHEEKHARSVCASLEIPLETCRLDVPAQARTQHTGQEATARRLRYAFLESVRQKHRADWIVTAHHGDDLAEDIMLRLVRGTGWPGLGGMPGIDFDRHLLRPLLDWDKTELRALAKEAGLSWCEDASNGSLELTRNRIRHHVLPLLQAENPAFVKAARNLWVMSHADADFWRNQLPPLPDMVDEYLLDADMLDTAHPALRLRLFKHLLDHMGPGQALAGHLLALDRMWRDKIKIRHIQFPGDKIATVRKDGIFFSRQHRHPRP